jgi:hypothetical protein
VIMLDENYNCTVLRSSSARTHFPTAFRRFMNATPRQIQE